MNKLLRILLVTLAIITLFIIATIVFSPYGSNSQFSYRLVIHTVEINAPVDSVFKFLGNSRNVSKWSVFVNHINTLNANMFLDGHVGSTRRCFCNADETGTQWDELILEAIPGKKRQIGIYNLKGFPLTANGLATEQLYRMVDNRRCELSFTVFFNGHDPNVFEKFKIYFAAYRIKTIFKKNMENIKNICEKENEQI